MITASYELDLQGYNSGILINDFDEKVNHYIKITAFDRNGILQSYQDLNEVNGRLDIVVSTEHLQAELREFILLKLNDDYRLGNLLQYLGIVKSCSNRLGSGLYILENVELEFLQPLYCYLDSVYIDAIDTFKRAKTDYKNSCTYKLLE
ncbi:MULTISPECIES: hypothetical protein [unclassified Clostridium]|uniref:hypothetical protein n=1 Tax=unclassified Clostridium TaxID=2614128 RepID=UPI0032166BFD